MFVRLTNCFTVFPEHTNSLSPLIFGGAFFAEMDKIAAIACRRLLYSSPIKGVTNAVTHKAEVKFYKPSYQENLMFLEAEIISVGTKSICVNVKAVREIPNDLPQLIAEIDFVFISVLIDPHESLPLHNKPDMLPYHEHGIKDEDVQVARKAYGPPVK